MKYNSALMSSASGSVGGLTASRNRGGSYFRKRAAVTNPSTPEQVAVRAALGTFTARWKTLTSEQRDGWKTYADNTPVPDTLGQPRNLTALNWYTAVNTFRQQAGQSIIDDAPVTFGLAEFAGITDGTLVVTDGGDIKFDFLGTDAWAGNAAGTLSTFVSRPQSPSIDFFKGPFQFCGSVDGNATPVVTTTETSTFTLAEGQKVFVRVRVSDAEGRLSSEKIYPVIVEAA